MSVRQKQRSVIVFLNTEEVQPIDIHKSLVNVCGARQSMSARLENGFIASKVVTEM